jgi:hypothetical protein
MDDNFTSIQGYSFFYQVGSVKVTQPWDRPSYKTVRSLFLDNTVNSILEKYSADMCGGCLWNMSTTWDLDLIFYISKDSQKNPSWQEIENDINTINRISLKKYRILSDITVKYEPQSLPTKQEIIIFKKNQNTQGYPYGDTVIRISGIKKIVNGIEAARDYSGRIAEKLTDNYLCRIYCDEHFPKIIDKIERSKKTTLIHSLNYKDFLSMNEDDFLQSSNY